MRRRTINIAVLSAALLLSFPLVSVSGHKEGKETIKGTVTNITVTEVELTVSDESGKERRIRTNDPSAFKNGDRVVIRGGKVSKEVRPVSGGY